MSRPIVRPAETGDLEALADISRNTWEGSDYLERIAPAWVAEGGFHVVEVDGVVAGCTKLSILPGPCAWLEGLRVHPSQRGRGLGRLLADFSFDMARGMAARSLVAAVEFQTYYHNAESISMALSRGFEIVERFYCLWRETPGSGPDLSFSRVEPGEDDISCYRGRVPAGWRSLLRTPETVPWIGARCSTIETEGLRFMRLEDGGQYALCSSSMLDPRRAAEAVAAHSAASGDGEAEMMLPACRDDALAAFLDAGWGLWEEPFEPNALVLRMRL